jgi:hypothetical protein
LVIAATIRYFRWEIVAKAQHKIQHKKPEKTSHQPPTLPVARQLSDKTQRSRLHKKGIEKIDLDKKLESE